MERIISFNKEGYDPFIDFIKCYSIICVLLGHSLPEEVIGKIGYGLWAGMQVPLFVLVQSFHFFKKKTSFDIRKILVRIVLPFVFIEVLTFTLMISTESYSTVELLMMFVKNGGYGPGSYFPWIYIQIALILPFVKSVFDYLDTRLRLNRQTIALTSILICESFELFFSYINLYEFIYRLLFVRYLFLLYLGWIWIKEGIKLNYKTLTFSIISMLTIIYFEHFSIDDEPFFFKTEWTFHRWPCFYYLSYLFGGGILYNLFSLLKKYDTINKAIKIIAKCSYEIFLVQMFFIVSIPLPLDFISNTYLQELSRILIIFMVSISMGYMFNMVYSNFSGKILRS